MHQPSMLPATAFPLPRLSRQTRATATRVAMIRAITRAVCGPAPQQRIATVLAATVADPALLEGFACPPDEACYARHLLHAGDGFSVLAIVWQPGQMSKVHGHLTWCALGVHRGTLTEALFRPGPSGWGLHAALQRHPGDVSHSAANSPESHRVANLGTETAISIHVYGAAFDRIGQDVNKVWTG